MKDSELSPGERQAVRQAVGAIIKLYEANIALPPASFPGLAKRQTRLRAKLDLLRIAYSKLKGGAR